MCEKAAGIKWGGVGWRGSLTFFHLSGGSKIFGETWGS